MSMHKLRESNLYSNGAIAENFVLDKDLKKSLFHFWNNCQDEIRSFEQEEKDK